ncbi:MAG: HEAT repeat domain-containing protein [candidate division WOR-3 bacterium]
MIDNTLVNNLISSDANIRHRAFAALKKLDMTTALETLIEALITEDQLILEELRRKIKEIAPNALSLIVKKLTHPNRKIRIELVKLLKEVGNQTISAELVNLLIESPEIRASAIEVLGYIKDPWSLDYIRDFIFDRTPEVRVATLKALGYFEDREYTDQIIKSLSDPEPEVRLAAIETLAMLKEPRAGEYLWELSLNDTHEEVRRQALWALKAIGNATIKAYEKYFDTEDIDQHNQIITELARYGKVIVFPALELTHHYNPRIRQLAVKILSELKDPIAVTRLLQLANDADLEVRHSALWALGKTKTEEAIKFLTQELENPNAQIADTAKEVLEFLGSDAARVLIELLPNTQTETQLKIIEIISKVGAPELLPIIKERLNDPRDWVRRILCEALSNFRHPEIANLLVEKCLFDRDTLVRSAAVRALGKLKLLLHLDAILSALQDNEEIVRLAAIRALMDMGEKSAGQHLLKFLTQGSDAEKISAIQTLKQLNYFEAIPLLKQLSRGWPFGKESKEVRVEAKRALKHLTEELWQSRP